MKYIEQPFVGLENELIEYYLVLGEKKGGVWSLCDISYGNVAARTVGTSRVGSIPYAEIQVEGGEKVKKGIPEHVGGPTRVPDGGLRNRANSFRCGLDAFQQLRLKIASRFTPNHPAPGLNGFEHEGIEYFFLKNILEDYNNELEQKALAAQNDHEKAAYYRKFKLKANDQGGRRWAVGKKKSKRMGTQANLEVPFRTIGVNGGPLSTHLEPYSEKALKVAQTRAAEIVHQLRNTPVKYKKTQYLTGKRKTRKFQSAVWRFWGIKSAELKKAVKAVNAYVDKPDKKKCLAVRKALGRWMKTQPDEWIRRGEPIWNGGLAKELGTICSKWGVPFTMDEQLGYDKDDRLRSLFTLYYYSLYIHNENERVRLKNLKKDPKHRFAHLESAAKDRWGLLPKVTWVDLWEHALQPRDRALIRAWTDNKDNWTKLKKQMTLDIGLVHQAGVFDTSFSRWVLILDNWHENLFKNGRETTDTGYYFSTTGKPLPVAHRKVERTVEGKSYTYTEPMVVFEARAQTKMAVQAKQAVRDEANIDQLITALSEVQNSI